MQTQLEAAQPLKSKVYWESSPEVKRGLEFAGNLIGGAVGGYICYWLTRLVVRVFNIAAGAIDYRAYLLLGIMSAAIIETARLSHEAALSVLGRREKYENLDRPEEASAFDRLRQHSWKVIKRIEQYTDATDVVFSRICGIHTIKEIQSENIRDRDLYNLEIIRRAFLQQVQETIATAIPQELGIYAVESMGFTILGGHLFVWLHGLMFFNGVLDKITTTFNKIHREDMEIKRRRAAEARDRAAAAA